jgi:hypothetical protein
MHPTVDWFLRPEIFFRFFEDTDLAHWAGMPAKKSGFISACAVPAGQILDFPLPKVNGGTFRLLT